MTPEMSGVPAYGGNRCVPGLRREEIALLAGVSVDYYTRPERGNLGGLSESVLDALARGLQLGADHSVMPDARGDAPRGAVLPPGLCGGEHPRKANDTDEDVEHGGSRPAGRVGEQRCQDRSELDAATW